MTTRRLLVRRTPDVAHAFDVPRALRTGCDLALDGGELPGVASTVIDLRDYHRDGAWRVLRAGALGADAIERALA